MATGSRACTESRSTRCPVHVLMPRPARDECSAAGNTAWTLQVRASSGTRSTEGLLQNDSTAPCTCGRWQPTTTRLSPMPPPAPRATSYTRAQRPTCALPQPPSSMVFATSRFCTPVTVPTHRHAVSSLRLTTLTTRTRTVTDIYRITTEGPLRHTAMAVLRLLGDEVSPSAGLNELRSRLLGFRGRTPLWLRIAELITPERRTSRAHEELHWDPDVGAAVLGERAVDLREVHHAANLAWSVACGFQSGAQIGCACLPELARTIDAIERPYAPSGAASCSSSTLTSPPSRWTSKTSSANPIG